MNKHQNNKRFSRFKRNFLGGLLVAAVIFGASLTASAQTAELKAQRKVWKTFQAAIARQDRAAVVKMMKFPFGGSIIGSESDHKTKTAADFIKLYRKIFTVERRRLIARGEISPTDDDEEFNFLMEENGDIHVFRFRKTKGVYKLAFTFGIFF